MRPYSAMSHQKSHELLKENSVRTVSYTHLLNILDVASGISLSIVANLYLICVLILFGAVGIIFFTNLLTLSLVLAVGPLFIGALAFEPVSYTHLDVYKRQG